MCWPYAERSPASSLTERFSVSSEWRSMPSVRCVLMSMRSLWKRLNFSGTSRASMASTALVRFGLNPRMSASDAALTWFGLAGLSRAAAWSAADGRAATLVSFAADSAFAETVLAIARTSSRLNAIGLVAAFRARMLSRRADFLDGFSTAGRLAAGAGAGAGAFWAAFGAALGAAFGAGSLRDSGRGLVLEGFVFLGVAMGRGWFFWGPGFRN